MHRQSINTKLFWLIVMGIGSAVLTSIFSAILITLSLKVLKQSPAQQEGEVVSFDKKVRRV